jgi:hypothetical protein
MSFYHGTSAATALKILQSRTVLPSKDGFFYCFDSARPESLAGALCFATGDGPRNGSLQEKDFFSKYAKLNPTFPTGLKGAFVKIALKKIAASWAKDQLKSASTSLDHQAAILVFRSHPEGIPRSGHGFVNEVQVPAAVLSSLVLECIYFDDSLLKSPTFEKLSEKLKQQGILVEPLSRCVEQVLRDCQDLQTKKKSKKRPDGPKN